MIHIPEGDIQVLGGVLLGTEEGVKVSKPFSDDAISLLSDLSKALLPLKQYPQLVALGYWLRSTNLYHLEQRWLQRQSEEFFLKPKGRVFHITPANVDALFAYVWALSLLLGNSNIVRLSSRELEEQEVLIREIARLLSQDQYRSIAEQNVFVRYDKSLKNITERFSLACQVRLVWGGDTTARDFNKEALPVDSSQIIFPDRHSLALIKSNQVCSENAERLALNLSRDINTFKQAACSSPLGIIWLGSAQETETARKLIWSTLDKKLVLGSPVDALVFRQYSAALGGEASRFTYSAYFSEGLPSMDRHPGMGIWETNIIDLSDLKAKFSSKTQSLSIFGFEKLDLVNWLKLHPDIYLRQIVPIGQALTFDVVWDGVDLMQSLSQPYRVSGF